MQGNPMAAEKDKTDNFIGKQRVAMYKPIQIAEILYCVRCRRMG
ncbi:MAG: HaeII family restriction endonuclease [Armatimonadota bacterium]